MVVVMVVVLVEAVLDEGARRIVRIHLHALRYIA